MPSAITHAFTGAAVSTLAPRRYRGTSLALILAAAAAIPDLDVLGFAYGIPYAHPLGHRGFSHSLLFAVLLAVALWLWLARSQPPLLSKPAAALLLVIFVACASHGFLDAFTDAGLGIGFFIPFSAKRYFFPWHPIRTSPLSPRAFFSGSGLAILRNEIAWVWVPTVVIVGAAAVIRRAALPRPASGHQAT
jgi:inner membrane protein